MQQDENNTSPDLAELFRQKISLSSPANEDNGQSLHPAPAEVQEVPRDMRIINYSISQHYTHSAHVAQNIFAIQASKSGIDRFPRNELSVYQTLAQHNIAPSSLLRSQLALFEQADDQQRSRLIRLWSISPSQSTVDRGQETSTLLGKYKTMTLEKEEEIACLQYQKAMFEGEYQDDQGDVYDTRNLYGGEGWQTAESYITAGYEHLAQWEYAHQEKKDISAGLSPSIGLIFGDRHNSVTDPVYLRNDCEHEAIGQQSTGYQDGKSGQKSHLQPELQQIITILESEDEDMF